MTKTEGDKTPKPKKFASKEELQDIFWIYIQGLFFSSCGEKKCLDLKSNHPLQASHIPKAVICSDSIITMQTIALSELRYKLYSKS